ncbi:MAG: hypothetical protein MJ231_00005, partial [bacterium]|nr:hypothetical protein [bacterium]
MKIIKGIFKFVILSMLLIILNVLSTFIFAKLNTILSFGSDCYFVNNEIFALISQIVSLLLFFLVPIVFYPILIRLQSIKLINTFFFDYEDVKKYFIIYAILDLPIFIVLLLGIETGMLFTNYLFYISWLHSYLVFFLIAQYKKSKYSKNNNAIAYSLISFIILCFILCYGHFYKDLDYEIVS